MMNSKKPYKVNVIGSFEVYAESLSEAHRIAEDTLIDICDLAIKIDSVERF